MRSIILELHQLANSQKRFSFSFHQSLIEIPKNGIYFIFEKGERYKDLDRIVRVGTHTGHNQLSPRLYQHFIMENKNRSIFRKNIGRCFLNKDNNSYLNLWELDITSRVNKNENLKRVDIVFEKQIESRISEYFRTNLSFCVFQIDSKSDRLFWESKIASSLAKAPDTIPSANWLGNYSPKDKIKQSGLWQVNGLSEDILTESEFEQLKEIITL